jgi:hypothetical protein
MHSFEINNLPAPVLESRKRTIAYSVGLSPEIGSEAGGP